MIIAIIAWLAGLGISFYNGNVKLPVFCLVAGIGLLIAIYTGHGDIIGTVGFVLLAVILIIANKFDMS